MSTSDNNRRGVGGALAFRATWGVDGHVSEDTVHAWMDDELDAADALAVESHIDGCASCAHAAFGRGGRACNRDEGTDEV